MFSDCIIQYYRFLQMISNCIIIQYYRFLQMINCKHPILQIFTDDQRWYYHPLLQIFTDAQLLYYHPMLQMLIDCSIIHYYSFLQMLIDCSIIHYYIFLQMFSDWTYIITQDYWFSKEILQCIFMHKNNFLLVFTYLIVIRITDM